MSMSLQYAAELVEPLGSRASTVLHVPVDPTRKIGRLPPGIEPPFGVTYAGNPGKKGLDLAIDAWCLASTGMKLLVSGITEERARAYLGSGPPREIQFVGSMSRQEHREMVRRAAVFVSASRREEYGTAQLEAVADGVPLVAVPSRGAPEPVAVARRVRPDLVAENISAQSLAVCVSRALAMSATELATYRERALQVMAPYSSESFQTRLKADVLPALFRAGQPERGITRAPSRRARTSV
jgi:glycogen synthase